MPKEQEPEIIDVEPERDKDAAAPLSQDRSIVLAGTLLPETLLIVPAFNRPLFPRTMGPIVIAGDELKREVIETLQSSRPYMGLVMVRSGPDEPSEGPALASDFHEVGVAVRVIHFRAGRSGSPTPARRPGAAALRYWRRLRWSGAPRPRRAPAATQSTRRTRS